MKFSKEAKEHMTEIQAIENKYGLMPFRMAFVYLFDNGYTNFNNDLLEKGLEEIKEEAEAENANGTKSFITPEFKEIILRCAIELSKFNILTLFGYIKKHFVVDI